MTFAAVPNKSKAQLGVTAEDRSVLRGLADEVREIAADPANNEDKIVRWKSHTGLRGERPMAFVFPDGFWGELLPCDSLLCRDPAARNVEYEFRKRLI